MRKLTVTIPTLLLLAASGCGSTAQQVDRAGIRGTAEAGLSSGDQGSAEGTRLGGRGLDDLYVPDDVDGTVVREQARGQTQRNPAISQPGASGSAAQGASPQGPQAATGRGFDQDEIYIGYGTANQVSATINSVGIESESGSFGDQEDQAQAIADAINEAGGIEGRKVVLVFYDFNLTSDASTTAQAACARWTEDQPVFAVIKVIGTIAVDEIMGPCLAQRQTPLINVVPFPRPQSVYERDAPYQWGPQEAARERYVPALVDRVAAQDYFQGWNTTLGGPGDAEVKVGVLAAGGAGWGQHYIDLAVRELTRHGQTVGATYEFNSFDEINQAVLRFKGAGVTHVFDDAGGTYAFSAAAETQLYRPRYVIHSSHNPNWYRGAVPPAQLVGALGMGHVPSLDIPFANDRPDASQGEVRCREVMHSAGQDTTSQDAFALMVRACDGFSFVTETIAAAGLSSQAVEHGARSLGSMSSPASTFAVSFSNGRFDGAAAARGLAYQTDCSCFVYTGTLQPL